MSIIDRIKEEHVANQFHEVKAMVEKAISKVRGAPVGAYLTTDHPNVEVGFEFVMVGPDGVSNRLNAAQTTQRRLDAHWNGFVDSYRGHSEARRDSCSDK